jgi:hypothetical protein
MSTAAPARTTIVTRKLAKCVHCDAMIYEGDDGTWRHDATGNPECGGRKIR